MMSTTVFLVLVVGFFARQFTISLGTRVEIPGRCSNVCSTNVNSVFFSCVDEIRRGCAIQLCNSPERSVRCGLRPGIPKVLFTGEEVSIFNAKVNRNMTTKIGIRGISPKTDIYFLVDGTGSMGAAIGALRRSFVRLAEAMKDVGDFAYGVGTFRDETELDMGFRHLQGISTNTTSVKEGVNKLRSKGGDDAEEANLVALYKIATGDFVKWRKGAGRVILLFGDAVGHEPTCFDDVVLNRSVVTRALNKAGITVQAVATEFSTMDDLTTQFGCGGGASAGKGQTTFIAEGTGGKLTTLGTDNAAEVFNVFSNILSTTRTVVTVAESNCGKGVIKAEIEPPLPAPLRLGEKLKVTFRIRKRACKRGSFECSISFGSGDSVSAPLKAKFADLTGCRP